MTAPRPKVLDMVRDAGHLVFDGGPWDVNIIAIRRGLVPDRFDDRLCLIYRNESGEWVEHYWPCTTDPGLYWLRNPERVDGTAIIAPGQHRSVYEYGKHKGEYWALTQRADKVIPVFRDGNRDGKIDRVGRLYQNASGINIHRANSAAESKVVDKWSAGCIVVPDPWDFAYFLSQVKRSMDRWGPYVTLTVLEQL